MAAYQKQTGFYLSSDGKTQVASYVYTPTQNPPKAVIHLFHGMEEYIERYEPWISLLIGAGYVVGGNDDLGHGSTGKPEDYGFFAEKDGYKLVLEDLAQMNRSLRKQFPGLPVIVYGHSMGSFFARYFAEVYPDLLDALVISGTAGPSPVNVAGLWMAKWNCKIHGPRYISQSLVNASTGNYSKGLSRKSAWLTHDDAVCEAYENDPKCTFPFTVSAYRDMLTVLVHVNRAKYVKLVRKDLPIYIMSGDQDPVGEHAYGPRAVEKLFIDAGAENLTLKLYKGDRHELHNELDRLIVFDDLKNWLDAQVEEWERAHAKKDPSQSEPSR